MAGATLVTFDKILKEDYKEPIRDLLNHKTLLLHRLDRNTEDVVGKRAYLPLRTGRNTGVGARSEAGTLPTAGQQSYSNATFAMTYHYGRIKVTGPVIAAARDNAGAFTRAVESEMEGLVRDSTRDQNRQLFGDGSGVLAVVDDSGADQTTIEIAAGSTTKNLQVGMNFKFKTAAGAATAAASNRTIESIIKDVSFTCAATDSEGAAAVVVRGDAGGDNYEAEMYGLQAAINDVDPPNWTTDNFFGGLERDGSRPWWEANVTDWSNAAFSQTIFQSMKDDVDIEGDGELSLFLTTHAIFNNYANNLLPDRRYNSDGGGFRKLDGGFDMLDYDGIPVAKDRDCPNNKLYGLSESTLMIFEMNDWDWMDKDGAILARVANEDAYEATLFKYQQLGCEDPRDNAVYENVGTAVGAV